jgi:hypothetical protein
MAAAARLGRSLTAHSRTKQRWPHHGHHLAAGQPIDTLAAGHPSAWLQQGIIRYGFACCCVSSARHAMQLLRQAGCAPRSTQCGGSARAAHCRLWCELHVAWLSTWRAWCAAAGAVARPWPPPPPPCIHVDGRTKSITTRAATLGAAPHRLRHPATVPRHHRRRCSTSAP